MEGPSLLLVFLAGIVSFASPCVLPLLPGYAAVIASAGPSRLRASAWFLSGFMLVFVALGASASALGGLFADHRRLLNLISGAVIVAMGLAMVARVTLPLGARTSGLASALGEHARTRGGPAALGVAFAFCWTPCIGPALASVLAFAASSTTLAQGVLLLAVYASGLALPFLAATWLVSRGARPSARLARLARTAQTASGGVLIALGLLMLSDRLWLVNVYAQRGLDALGLDWWTLL